MASKKYTLPAPEQIVSASAVVMTEFIVQAGSGEAHVAVRWTDGSGNPVKSEVIGLSASEADDLLSGYVPGSETFEERVLSWLSSNGKVTGGGSVEDAP